MSSDVKPSPSASAMPSRNNSSANLEAMGKRRRPSEFMLPDGKKVLVALPEEAVALREKYAGTSGDDGPQIEVVVHGSEEHRNYLHKTRSHHESRREGFRERFGADYEEWERVAGELDSVTEQLEHIADHAHQLGHNFSKFGYSAQLRTYGGDKDTRSRSGVNSSAVSLSEESTIGEEKDAWEERRGMSTMKLFRRPVIKQYFHKGLLWRASEETTVMSFELFFDLLYGKRAIVL
jgi:hypothetical protein